MHSIYQNKKKKFSKVLVVKGFTLIELVVTLTIIAILSTIGIAAFVNQSRTSALQTGASQFVSALNLAKSRAMSQVKPSVCEGDLEGYIVTITDSDTYQLDVECGGTHSIQSNQKLPSNITFVPSGGDLFPLTFSFAVLTNAYTGTSEVTISGYGEQIKTVNVDNAGNIKLN